MRVHRSSLQVLVLNVIPPECDKEPAAQPLCKSPTQLTPLVECTASAAACTPNLHETTPTSQDAAAAPTPSLQQNGLLDNAHLLKSANSSTKKRSSAKWSGLPISPEASLDPSKYLYVVQDVALPGAVSQVPASQLR